MRYFISGGAGFIGSHLTHCLLNDGASTVTVFDDFSSGRLWHLDGAGRDRITVLRGDLKDLPAITTAMGGHDVVFHLASNPDIARAATEPVIDFWEGTYLTQNLIEAMRVTGVRRLIYASGSGVYGDTGDAPVFEDYAPLVPISTPGVFRIRSARCCSWTPWLPFARGRRSWWRSGDSRCTDAVR